MPRSVSFPKAKKVAVKPATKTRKKAAAKRVEPAPAARPRRLRLPAYRPFRLKRIKYPEKLPSNWRILQKVFQTIRQRRFVFLDIAVVYAVLTIMFVIGVGGVADVQTLKQEFSQGLSGSAGQLITGLSVFTALIVTPSDPSNTDTSGGVYQLIFALIISLATIWTVRQTVAGYKVGLRDAFYRGIYPLVPFVLVLLVVLLQTVPFLIGGYLYTTVTSNGIAATTIEQVLWGALFFVLTLMSVYMLCSSLFALYIVTLPDMTPIKALRSARQLVRYRRGAVFRKLLFMLAFFLVVVLVIMLPIIWFVPIAAPWVLLAIGMVGLVVLHVYMYTLYKALLA